MIKRASGDSIAFRGSLTPNNHYHLVKDLSLKYPVYQCMHSDDNFRKMCPLNFEVGSQSYKSQ